MADIAGLAGLVGKVLESALDDINIDLLKLYCCPKDDAAKWQNCKWYGQPGSCFDNHCPNAHSVQLTDSPYGLGDDCFPHVERTRVFCCDPTHGKSPFLPVPLQNLFPHPPSGDHIDTDFTLETDDTWGTGKAKEPSDEPSDAAFEFVVLTSPEELQISLDKRDGSHWDVYNCADTDSEEPQTVQMVCTDVSENSNCHKIGLGHGVAGTILQMPPGCGPGKYAVAKDMVMAKHQILPRRLANLGHKPVVYDLTFDYDFLRVPRDLGDTQMRIDFSNEVGYWDNVVAAAADGKKKRKSKRTLADVGGSHKRWLEEEFRDDLHFGGLSTEELHARWFGSAVLDWLRKMLKPEISKKFTHDLDETYTAKIVEARWHCPGHDGFLLAQALANIKVSTSFGFTLITKLSLPIDLSQSYLTFSNKGDITATFTLEAFINFFYDTKEIQLLDLPFPGAGLRIPGIATIGPALLLRGRVEASLTISAELEARVDVASWEFEYKLPAALDPSEPDPVDYGHTGDKNGVEAPQFYAGVQAQGNAKAHIIAALEFGVRFDDRWKVGAAAASVVADGWVGVNVAAGISTKATCPFTWGLEAGVDLYAKAEAPDAFGWKMGPYPLPGSTKVTIYPGGQCPDLRQGAPERRRGLSGFGPERPGMYGISDGVNKSLSIESGLGLRKRSQTIGPFINIPAEKLLCPNAASASGSGGTPCSRIKGWEDSDMNDAALKRRTVGNVSEADGYSWLDRRSTETGRTVTFCRNLRMKVPPYETSGSLSTVSN